MEKIKKKCTFEQLSEISDKKASKKFAETKIMSTFAPQNQKRKCSRLIMVPVVQLVRASDCGSECRGFESHRAPFSRNFLRAIAFRIFF